MGFKTYHLSEDKLRQIARLCTQEQGSIAGIKAEASQGANLLETNANYRKRFGIDIYNMFRNSGWYYKAVYFMDYGSASDAAVEAVRDVLVNGNRVFPQYVDEHDCLSDIKWVKTDGKFVDKKDRSAYVKGRTVIANNMGSKYTFYAFPAPGCDPFGYTDAAYEYVLGEGGSPEVPDQAEEDDTRVSVTVRLPELYKDCPKSKFVSVWRLILGMKTNYKTFNDNVKEETCAWQKKHGLQADGIVGRKTWAKAFEEM